MEQTQEIHVWRGLCLDYFGRAELAIGVAIKAAHASGKADKLRHLAGQRLADLVSAVERVGGTTKQINAFKVALEPWQSVEQQRQFLAHGVSSELRDMKGNWVVMLDLTTFRSNTAQDQRWTVTKSEAATFQSELELAFKNLSSQLGQFRKRLKP